MARTAHSYIKILFGVLLIIAIAAYAYSKSDDFAAGPTITILSPKNGTTVNESLIEIQGFAEHISHITLNGRQIFTTEEGIFDEQLLLAYGYNIITLTAQDRFERTITKTLELVYK